MADKDESVYGHVSLQEAKIDVGNFPDDLIQELVALNKKWSDTRRQSGIAKQLIPQSKLHVQLAEYVSVQDDQRREMVTDCLKQMIANDRLILEVQNHNFIAGGKNSVQKDPHTGVKKKLRVIYSFNGAPLQVVEKLEGEILDIPELPKLTSSAWHRAR